MKVLVTGGVRSGKSFHAESLVLAEQTVTYVAPGPTPDAADDPDAAARVRRHQERRPRHWVTVESSDLAAVIGGEDGHADEGAVLVDCLGQWLRSQLDELDGWAAVQDEWEPILMERVDAVADALALTARTVVLVTNEVGMGSPSDRRSARLHTDLLGAVNQRLAAECDQVLLVVAGRVLAL